MGKYRKTTVLMYHYVRPIAKSRFPKIKGVERKDFRSQIEYLEKNYTFITIEEMIDAIETGAELPPKSVLLTFNDAFSDHFENVFPILDDKGIQGCFYPEISAIKEEKVLLNHKIHFILAAASNPLEVQKQIFLLLDELRKQFKLESDEYYLQKIGASNTRDSKEIVFIKRLLQTELDEQVREIIGKKLFQHFVDVPEEIFSKELYLNRKHIECMINHGMHFGILGYSHRRYDTLPVETQREEIECAKRFLIDVYGKSPLLTASYPWGKYNQYTLTILGEIGCKVAFTTYPDVADLDLYHQLEIPRLDTNEIPKSSEAEPNKWYVQA